MSLLTFNSLGLVLFVGPLKIVERHLRNQIVRLVLSLIHQGSPYRCINSGPYRLGHSIGESLNNHPSLKAMVRAQPQQVFKPLLSLIECLIIPLHKVGDLVPQTFHFAWCEEFGEESSSKLIPCGNAPERQRMKPCCRHVPSSYDRQCLRRCL